MKYFLLTTFVFSMVIAGASANLERKRENKALKKELDSLRAEMKKLKAGKKK